LMQMCFQGWVAAQAELLADKEIDALAAKAEQQYKDFMAKKSGEAKGVLDRMSGASDSGLLHNILKAWCDFIKEVKEERRMEELINGNDAKFKSLARNQSKNAKSVASRCHQQEEENMIMAFFYAWSTETKVEHVIKVYGQKLDQKKGQLDAVQTMFRSFASQLEQGIGNTPRSKKSTGRSRGGEGSTVGAG